MKPIDKHPTRQELLKAIKNGNISIERHLQECIECSTLYFLLEQYSEYDSLVISRPDDEIIKRYASIPLLSATENKVKPLFGKLVFDSWAGIPALQLRDKDQDGMRRLCMRAGRIRLEIIAERQQYNWSFTARVYDDDEIASGWILSAGRDKILPDSLGFYQWNTSKKPHSLKLFNLNNKINFKKISWA
jgi:hypothetical protein